MRKIFLWFAVTLTALSMPLTLLAAAQQESLGDIARQLREQRQKEGKKATKVFTNDNLPASPPGESTPKEPVITTSTGEDKTVPAPSTPEKKAAESESPESKLQTKEYWEARFLEARRSLAHAKEQLQLSEDEMNLLQIQQAREIDPGMKDAVTAKLQAKQSEVEVLRAATAAAQKNLDDLEQEFKDSGAPDDWRPAP